MSRFVSLTAALLVASAAHGQVVVPEGPEFQVNQANGSGAEKALRSTVAMNADGSFVVVWSSAIEGVYHQLYYTGLRGQRFDADARPRGDEIRVDFDETMTEPTPDVAASANGNFIVVWSGDQGIRGRRFASSGESLGGEFQISSQTRRVPGPVVAAGAAGDFVVVWTSTDMIGTEFDVNLRGRRFAADATPLTDEFQVNTYTTDYQAGAAIDAAPDGRFVVVWTSSELDLRTARIRGRRFAADATPEGDDFQVDSMPYQRSPAVAVAPDGGFVVVWTSAASTAGSVASSDIHGRLFAADGAPRSEELLINTETLFQQFGPSVAVDADGNFVAAWTSDQIPASGTPPSGQFDIRARQFSSEGVPTGVDFQVNTYTTYRQSSPAIAMTATGEAVVVWDWYNRVSRMQRDYNVRGQRLAVAAAAATEFVWSPEDPIGGQNVQFFDVSPGEPTVWSWDFGDGSTSDLRNPAHVYASAGRYPVTLTVSGAAATGSVSHLVQVFGCNTDTTRLCVADRRFAVEIHWTDFRGARGNGRVVPGVKSDDSGIFYFFSPNNWELLVKVLNGCSINGHYWVFAAATTNVQYRMRVTDLETGKHKEYLNPLGTAAPAVTDTAAFAECP